jgi:branched-chain amino acid aminotransferase
MSDGPISFVRMDGGTPASAEERAARLRDPGFGRYFTDHMVTMRWRDGEGWGDGRLQPFAPLSISPAASALHYGQAIFEGFKAYHQADGGLAAFRPEQNARRFAASAERLAIPPLPAEAFLGAVQALATADAAWVPTAYGESLYFRPLIVATEAALGVRPSSQYLFVLFASPAGSYFPSGVRPLTVWAARDYVRAAPGGTGFAKCAGNYAASLVAQRQARENGCDQVLWLDAGEHRFVEELGGMNVCFVFREPNGERTLVTPELSGTLLAGVTRDSLLTLAREAGLRVEERRLELEECRLAAREGRLEEAFACGTAAVITPIGRIREAAREWQVADGASGEVTMALRKTLLDIQHGLAEDRHGWMVRVG